jgi:hypothetical protein
MKGSNRQTILSNLLKRRIKDKQTLGMRKLLEMQETLKDEMRERQSRVGRAGKGFGFLTDLFVPGSSKITSPIAEYMADASQDRLDLSDFDLSPEEGVWGIGDMFKGRKEDLLEAWNEDKANIWETISESGKGFLGKEFLEEWGKGGGNWKTANIEGLSILDKLFSNTSIPTTFFKQGGMVKKYQDGGTVLDEMFEEGDTYQEGDTHWVKEGGTYKEWTLSDWGMPEQRSFPYYAKYRRNADGTLEKISSSVKKGRYENSRYKDNPPPNLKTLSQLESMVSQEDLTAAGGYLESGDTGLYKQDEAMQSLVDTAKGDKDSPETKAALRQLALLAKARNPNLKDKSMESITASIADGLSLVDIDLQGEGFQDIKDVYEGTEETLASSLAKGKNILGADIAKTYDPTMSERERRRALGGASDKLSGLYSTYDIGRGTAARAYDTAMDTETATEFGGLDTLFDELEV